MAGLNSPIQQVVFSSTVTEIHVYTQTCNPLAQDVKRLGF